MEPHQQRYLQAVSTLRQRAEPGSYDAIYWAIDLKHDGGLSSIELHRRTMRRLRDLKKRT
jgi:hypothetical protein